VVTMSNWRYNKR